MSGTVVSRCDPPLPLDTPNGPGLAHWRIERGLELPTTYEVWLTDGPMVGQIWEFSQVYVRAQQNTTVGRSRAGGGEMLLATEPQQRRSIWQRWLDRIGLN